MHIEFLVEEPSAEVALTSLMPKLLPGSATWSIHSHGGKPDLLGKLPARLKAYAQWLPSDWRIVVLIDEDRENCKFLKKSLEEAAHQAGMITKGARRGNSPFQIVNRIAIEELEAWFFGDPEALRAAFPRLSQSLERKRQYRDPDAIAGGTWEALERILQRAGYYRQGLAKIDAARRIAEQMDPNRNRSRSFRNFINAVRSLIPS